MNRRSLLAGLVGLPMTGLATSAITGSMIVDGSISTQQLVAGAVTAEKIESGDRVVIANNYVEIYSSNVRRARLGMLDSDAAPIWMVHGA